MKKYILHIGNYYCFYFGIIGRDIYALIILLLAKIVEYMDWYLFGKFRPRSYYVQ